MQTNGMISIPGPGAMDQGVMATGPAVVLAESRSLVRQGLRHVVDAEMPGCRVIETDRLAPTVAILREIRAEMLLIGLDLPGMCGADSLKTLRCLNPRLMIGVVFGGTDWRIVADCLAAGINGFIHHQEPIEEIGYAVTTMLAGRIYVSPALAHPPKRVPLRPALAKALALTSRQQEVLRLLEQGRSNKEIARALALSESTVKIHLAAIYRSLGARNRTEAVVNAGRERP
jgi:DNA-binding NarL/FixJ family response regulator